MESLSDTSQQSQLTGCGVSSEMKRKIQATEDKLLNLLNPIETQIMSVQSLLVWEKPRSSAAMFVTVNCLFWFATVTTYRVYFLVGVVGMVVVFVDMWKNRIWPEIRVPPPEGEDQEGWTPVHPSLVSLPELCTYMAEFCVWLEYACDWLINMHREKPAKFCLLTTFCLGSLAVIGLYIPGTYICYIAVISVLLWPCVVYHSLLQKAYEKFEPVMLRLEYKLKIKRKRSKKAKRRHKKDCDMNQDHVETESETDLEEFCPPPDPVATAALARVITDSEDEDGAVGMLTPVGIETHSVHNSDLEDLHSDDESFSLGVNSMPSFDDTLVDEDSRAADDISEPSIIPSMDVIDDDSLTSLMPTPENNQPMHFDPQHFKDYSDSSDNNDEALSTGLSFPDIQSPDHNQSVAAPNPQEVASMGVSQTVSSLMASTISGLGKLGQSVLTAAMSDDTDSSSTVSYKNEQTDDSSSRTVTIHTPPPPQLARKTSDESDIMEEFEFLEQEDFDSFENSEKGKEAKKKD